MSSIQKLIAQKQKDLQAKKGRANTFKPAAGKTRVRILPSWRGLDDPNFFHEFGQHFAREKVGGKLSVYLCTEATFGKECPVCSAIGQGISTSSDDDTIKLLKQANAGQRYLMNALVLSDENKKNEPQILEVGITVFEAICEIIGEYDDITALSGGTDLVITREGTGQFDTKYTVMPSPKSANIPKEIYAKVANLDDYVAQEDDLKKTKAISAVSRAAGFIGVDDDSYVASTAGEIEASKTAAPTAGSKGSDINEVIEDAEIIETDTSLETVTAEPAEIDDADLDDLLADLG